MEYAVELRDVTKIFSDRSAGRDVRAIQHIHLAIRPGEFFTLLGPSGCGKTTTLRIIAGFETPTHGEVLIQGKSMASAPPNVRPVNTVFQSYALFPHLSVRDNVAFGLAVKRVPRDERLRRAEDALALVRLPGQGRRKPTHLSGGQQQRVALARALVNRPAVLLLDEPLGALDQKLRKEMQLELKELQIQLGITFIYVTHDQEEALTMSDRIAVMDRGFVLQVGDPVTIYERPQTRFVADFIGESNFLSAKVDSAEPGRVGVSIGGRRFFAQIDGAPVSPEQNVTVTVRPERLTLHRANGTGEAGLVGAIHEIVYIGTDTRYVVKLTTGERVVARIKNVAGRGLGEYRVNDAVSITWSDRDARVLTG